MRTTIRKRPGPNERDKQSPPRPSTPPRCSLLVLSLLVPACAMTSSSFERRVVLASDYVLLYCQADEDLRAALRSASNKRIAPNRVDIYCARDEVPK